MGFTAAIIGRPNVGKSTLFNRLTGKKLALVDDQPGVTRDRREAPARIAGLEFTLIDTAGLEDADSKSLEGRMQAQTEQAVADADVVLFIYDARSGLTPIDKHFAEWARQSQKPVIIIANKCEGQGGDAGYWEGFSLGLGDPVRLSAEHGEGLADLFEALQSATELLETHGEQATGNEAADEVINVAVIGRPNAGKSTLINALVGQERLLTGPEAGITRDAIAVDWRPDGLHFRLYDTAGMRKRARVQNKLEKLSVSDGLRAVKFAHVVILLLDATSPLDRQDKVLAQLVAREGRAPIIVLNKWDLVEDKKTVRHEVAQMLDLDMPESRGVDILEISALKNKGLEKIPQAVIEAYKTWNTRITTAQLNRWLEAVTTAHPPPAVRGRRIRFRYMTQIKTRPPTFVLFCSRPDVLPDSYRRYLANELREAFDLWGTPLRLRLQKGKNPYVSAES